MAAALVEEDDWSKHVSAKALCFLRPISSYFMFFLTSDGELPLTCKDQPYAGELLAFLDLLGPVNHGVNVNT